MIERPYLLCIETATQVCSVAIFQADELICSKEEVGFVHSAKTAVFIKECLQEAGLNARELSAIAVDIGPGSYTGLRVGLSTAKGMCYALGLPLIALSGLEVLADVSQQETGSAPNSLYMPMIDARRMEVYTMAIDEKGKIHIPQSPFILEEGCFEDFVAFDRIYCGGDGSQKLERLELPDRVSLLDIRSDARHMGRLAHRSWEQKDFADLSWVEPEYIKPPNITKSKKTLL